MGSSNSKQINSHVQNAQKTGVCQLSEMEIKEFPPGILSLRNLRSLDLSKNKIEILPDAVGAFFNLKSLNLDNNLLTSLPESIGKLKKLETLSISNNSISKLPDSIEACKSLVTLNAASNRIQQFPAGLCTLKKLDAIDLHSNKITTLPNEIGQISAVEINLNNNRIQILPDILADCPRLKVFRFQENNVELKNIPTRVLSSSKISLLVYEGNVFTDKAFQNLDGYEQYMERYTATKRKFD